jgi:hypothetical protein
MEAGFIVVAINIPYFWYYTYGIKPESILRSVQSLVSLGSSRSSHNNSSKEIHGSAQQNTKEATWSGQSLDNNSVSSTKPWTTPADETYAMGDMSKTPPSS